MKRGGEQQSTQGFTIVETMIVLAVTGVLFALAVVLVSGRQNKTDFQVGSRKIAQDIQRIVNETQSGYYPNNTNFTCSAAGGGSSNVRINGGTTRQGSNSDCIFGGKVITFSSTNPTEFSVYSMAGRRLDSSGSEVTSAADAWLTVIPSSTLTNTISNGLQYVGAVYSGTSYVHSRGVGAPFISSFDQSSAGTNTQTMALYQLTATWPSGLRSDNAATYLNAEAGRATPYPGGTRTLQLCFRSGGTDQSVRVDISPALDVTYEIKNGITCGGLV